jgi:CBS domain containing-hemolysin-like protein
MLDALLKLGAVGFLIMLNGFFVASEFALVTARRPRIDELVDEGSRSARAVQRALEQPARFISACQIGITLSSLVLGWIAEPAVAHLFEPWLDDIVGEQGSIGSQVVSAMLALVLIASIHLIVGEQVPKMIGVQRSERAIVFSAPVIGWLSGPIRPLVAVLYWATDRILDLLGLSRQAEHSLVYTEDELRMLVTASRMQGYLEPSEQEMIERVFEFADVETDEIMIPRTEMQALPADATREDVTSLLAATGHTKFPVYGDDLDDLVGIFHIKDLVREEARGDVVEFSVRRFVRPALVVSAHTHLDELLATMKTRKSRMAIVVDEYGGTAGLVTLEDVLERIVGNLQDRQEAGPADAEELGNGVVRLSGLLSIADVNDRFGTHIDENYYNSIGGFVFGQIGRRPEVGDEVRANGHRFRVAALDGLRIDRVEIETVSSDAAHESDAETMSEEASGSGGAAGS